MLIDFDTPGPGQESVWDYPRPAQVETTGRRVTVRIGGVIVADTTSALRYLETSHPPSYFVPLADVMPGVLSDSGTRSACEWRGEATYYDIVTDAGTVCDGAVAYLDPNAGYTVLKEYVAFFAGRGAECFLDGQPVQAQEGAYFCGWITPDVVGPFKGAPGTFNW